MTTTMSAPISQMRGVPKNFHGAKYVRYIAGSLEEVISLDDQDGAIPKRPENAQCQTAQLQNPNRNGITSCQNHVCDDARITIPKTPGYTIRPSIVHETRTDDWHGDITVDPIQDNAHIKWWGREPRCHVQVASMRRGSQPSQ